MRQAEVTIGRAWRAVRDRFAEAGLASPALDARLLAEAAFALEGAKLIVAERETAPAKGQAYLDALAARRLAGEPVARILGHKEFYGLDFALNAATLVPRPETELVVDLVLSWPGLGGASRLLDLGTGSGAIAVAVLANAPHMQGTATDVSAEALEAARSNADRHEMRDRLEVRQGVWFAPVGTDETFDVIVSNPPYIETAAIDRLERDVRVFDPMAALDGGEDGLEAYRSIFGGAGVHLRPGGLMVVEIGAAQGGAVCALADAHGAREVEVKADLEGRDRAVVVRW